MGDAPSIATLKQTYPEEQINGWMMAHLMDLYKFAGVKEKPDIRQIMNLAAIIQTEYYYFKASEILLFFHRMKAGHYGTFFGVVDPMIITNALIQFKAYRKLEIDRYEREHEQVRREKQHDEWEKKAVPCPENLSIAKEYVETLQNKPL